MSFHNVINISNQPQFDNLQNELRRELDPQGFLEEEVFQAAVHAARNRRVAFAGDRYAHDRAFFRALDELRALQSTRGERPRPQSPRPVGTLMMMPPRRPPVATFGELRAA